MNSPNSSRKTPTADELSWSVLRSFGSDDSSSRDPRVHPALEAADEDADLARKRFMTAYWKQRVAPEHQAALESSLAARDSSLRTNEVWRNVFWFAFVPPTASVHVFASRAVRWRMYGGGIPFYLDGRTDELGYVKLYVGWAISFVSVDVLLGPNDLAQAIFEAFPGPKPTPEWPRP